MPKESRVEVEETTVVVSVIIPIYNAEEFLEECLLSVGNQVTNTQLDASSADPNLIVHPSAVDLITDEHVGSSLDVSHVSFNDNENGTRKRTVQIFIQVSMFDDGSSDNSATLIDKWSKLFSDMSNYSVVTSTNPAGLPKGVGYAKNRAIEQSTGEYLCFCDADDVMEPNRVAEQFRAAYFNRNSIVGSKFTRRPQDSTKSFTHWANNIRAGQLETQIYMAFGPTVVMPTWFCHRSVCDRIPGCFCEEGKGVPEDLIFFYKHLNRGGSVCRVDQSLMVYRYHMNATTFSVADTTIWKTRISHFCKNILTRPEWQDQRVTIWGAGKLGKRFFRSISDESNECDNYANSIRQFCDIDEKKIRQKFYEPYPNPRKLRIPIVRVEDAKPPLVICIKTEFMWDPDGPFQKYAADRNLIEGTDYIYFS